MIQIKFFFAAAFFIALDKLIIALTLIDLTVVLQKLVVNICYNICPN